MKTFYATVSGKPVHLMLAVSLLVFFLLASWQDIAVALDDGCIKCTELGCVGGTLNCASFKCKGVDVLCYTGGPPQP